MSAPRVADAALWATEGDAILRWLLERGFRGSDPFDGLESRLFQATPLARIRLARLAWLQLFKRSPLNLRPVCAVPPLQNPKLLGLVLSALARRAQARGRLEHHIGEPLIKRLAEDRPPGSRGWGYPFAWQNRSFFAPRGTPNAVCTVFVVAGLLEYSRAGGGGAAEDLAVSALPFFRDELRRSVTSTGVCFSYTPVDDTRIHNVNLLVAATIARFNEVTGDAADRALAESALRYSLAAQRRDGAWPYGDGPTQGWVDSFHTGYNLGALRVLGAALGSHMAREGRERGYAYFRRYLVEGDGTPRYYDRSRYPLDVHAAAQAILTLLDCVDLDADAARLGERVGLWAVRKLRLGNGRYLYQRGRLAANPIVYARWGQGWMLRAFAQLEARQPIGSVDSGNPALNRSSGSGDGA